MSCKKKKKNDGILLYNVDMLKFNIYGDDDNDGKL